MSRSPATTISTTTSRSRVGTFDPVSSCRFSPEPERGITAEIRAAGLPLEALAPALSGLPCGSRRPAARRERSANGAPPTRSNRRRASSACVSRRAALGERNCVDAHRRRRARRPQRRRITPGGHVTFDLLADAATSRVRFNAGVFNLADRTCWEWSDVRSFRWRSGARAVYRPENRCNSLHMVVICC